jgi:hypothetical protein
VGEPDVGIGRLRGGKGAKSIEERHGVQAFE